MRPSDRLHPFVRVHPRFRKAVQLAMHSKRISGRTLATVSGYAHQSDMSHTLYAKRLEVTPLRVSRLEKVAAFVGYTGPIFIDPDEEA